MYFSSLFVTESDFLSFRNKSLSLTPSPNTQGRQWSLAHPGLTSRSICKWLSHLSQAASVTSAEKKSLFLPLKLCWDSFEWKYEIGTNAAILVLERGERMSEIHSTVEQKMSLKSTLPKDTQWHYLSHSTSCSKARPFSESFSYKHQWCCCVAWVNLRWVLQTFLKAKVGV